MRERRAPTPLQALSRHFFWRFFQTENVGEGDTSDTPVVRALSGVAVPMLMAAFWNAMLAVPTTAWNEAGIHSLFVVYAFCSMGCITALQWDKLFPERIDFLILLPLPPKPRVLFLAKLQAVALFLLMFVVAGSIFGTLLLPALAGRRVLWAMLAHGTAVMSAGIAASLAVLAFEAVVIAVTPDRWFRYVAAACQVILVAAFLLIFLRVGTIDERLRELLGGSVWGAGWFPPLWFESVYEVLLGSGAATGFAHVLAMRAVYCLPWLCAAVVLTYPLAWAKRRRAALEGVNGRRLRDGVWIRVAHRTVLRSADQRAVFHFIRQTLSRLSQYHVLLAAYCGCGLALGIAFAVSVSSVAGHLYVSLWRTGVQGAVPLLLFWAIAGLRVAFLLPTDLAARWIFRLAPLNTQRVVTTTKVLVFSVAAVVLAAVVGVLALFGWSARDLALQAVFGLIYAMLLTDIFFYGQSHVPFTRPRLPGRSSLPMTIAVFLFGVPLCMSLAVILERWVRYSPVRLLETCVAVFVFHAVQRWLRGLPSHSASEDPFLGELDQDVQTLGLSS
ncbi:hypothetical protein [Terriglobus sp. TAA 43]|uniref:hypothetical protein n=1 Tax=Terriglobus sp. TAA 43 TaxID=278961 RepID=UPI000647948D|nr:hypothetical protein [Terriglobus sp. TAA 43]